MEIASADEIVRRAQEIIGSFRDICKDGGPDGAYQGDVQINESNQEGGFVVRATTVISSVKQIFISDSAGFDLEGPQPQAVAERQVNEQINVINSICAKANDVISRANNQYATMSSRKIEESKPLLDRYDGLPVKFNILQILGVDASEAAFCRMLTWLLHPEESHGLDDVFLRAFLARIGCTNGGAIFNFTKDLKAKVLSEVSWEIPSSILDFKRTDRDPLNEDGAQIGARRLRVDILIILDGLIIPVEVKVYSTESFYLLDGKEWSQAALYGKMWQLMLKDLKNIRVGGELAGSSGKWYASLLKCLKSKTQLGETLPLMAQGRAEVLPVLIHDSNRCHNKDSPIGSRPSEHGTRVRHLRWLDIDAILEEVCRTRDLDEGQLDLIRSFRTTILRVDSAGFLAKIEDLRLRRAAPALVESFPIESSASLSVAHEEIERVDRCCK